MRFPLFIPTNARDRPRCAHLAFAALLIGSCFYLPASADPLNGEYSNLVSYDCDNGRSLSVHYISKDDEEYALLITGGEVQKRLELSRSGSGVLYTDGTLYSLDELQWHTKDNEGLLIKQGKTLKCIESEADDTPETNQE